MLSYRLALAFGRLISYLPFWLLYRISDGLAWLMDHALNYRAEVIDRNLARSFPRKSETERKQIKKAFYRNFADILVESFKSLSISEQEMRKRYRCVNPEVFEKFHKADRGLIMVMGHHTNFEWTAMATPLMVPQACFAVYHRLKNPRFNKKVVEIREQFGLKLFPMHQTYPFMLNNEATAPLYVFMADQSPHKGKIKYRTPFLNQDTPVHLGVENLAKKCDLGVVFIDIRRVKRGHYEMEAQELYWDTQDTERYEVTKKHVAALEKLIRRDPANWLWSHKRWKHA